MTPLIKLLHRKSDDRRGMYGATGLRLAGAAMLLLLPVSLLAWSPSKVLEVYRAPFASQLCHSIETASKHAPEQDQEPPPADDEEPECD